jgi:hypothetical protein
LCKTPDLVVVEIKLESRRKMERAQIELIGNAQNDVQELEVKRWQQKANDGEE